MALSLYLSVPAIAFAVSSSLRSLDSNDVVACWFAWISLRRSEFYLVMDELSAVISWISVDSSLIRWVASAFFS